MSDAEIEQPHLPVLRHEDVARLQVAVDHEIAVCELHGRAHIEKQAQSLLDTQSAAVAVARDRLAGYELHDEIRSTRRRDARIEHARDVRVLKASEDASLAQEPALQHGGDGTHAHDFDGYLLFVRSICALCEIDGAHAAVADFAQHAIGAKQCAGGGGCRRV